MSDAVNNQQIPWWDRRNVVSDRRKKRAAETKSWSSYWMDDDSYDYFYKGREKKGKTLSGNFDGFTTQGIDIERAHRLSQLRRAVSNFVRIMTNRTDLQVVFNGGQSSFTNNEVVVISADDNPANFDRVVGTALHEAAHCVFTTNLWSYTKNTRNSTSSKRRIMIKHGVDLDLINKIQMQGEGEVGKWIDDQWDIFFKILNFVEDRRIDNEVYKRAPGYRPYYQAMYDHYWNHSEIASNLIFNPELNVPTLESYLTRVINMTNPATKYTLNRLPGFKEIVELVDLDNILRFSYHNGQAREYDIMDLVAKIYTIIATNAIEAAAMPDNMKDQTGQACSSGQCDEGDESDESQDGDAESDTSTQENRGEYDPNALPNYDGALNPSNDTKSEDGSEDLKNDEIAEKVSDELGEDVDDNYDSDQLDSDMEDFLNNESEKDELDEETQDVIDALEDGNTELDSMKINGQDVNYVRMPKLTTKVYDKLVPDNVKSNYRLKEHAPWVSNGRRLGQVIVNKIQIRHDKNSHKFTRRKRGKIDPRLIHSLGMGNQNVFYHKIEETYKDTLIYLTIDASSSIASSWFDIMTMAVGFGYAAKKINNFDVVINVRYGISAVWSITLFDSRTNNLNHLYKMSSAFTSKGGTPESVVYEIEMDYINEMKTLDNNVYFVTLTDGAPNFYGAYGMRNSGEAVTPADHCRKMMHRLAEIGISPLAYFVTPLEPENINYNSHVVDTFKKSYGKGAKVVPMKNFTKIADTLNKFLTEGRQYE